MRDEDRPKATEDGRLVAFGRTIFEGLPQEAEILGLVYGCPQPMADVAAQLAANGRFTQAARAYELASGCTRGHNRAARYEEAARLCKAKGRAER